MKVMAEKEPLKEEHKEEDGVWYSELQHGEMYETTKQWKWANYDDRTELFEVPAGEQILFRSCQAHTAGKELALFYWLKEKSSLCLVCSEEAGLIYAKHVPWGERQK